MSTILTLRFDEGSQGRFEGLRRLHYPVELNRIAAHLTLFHTLPGTETVRAELVRAALRPGFRVRVGGVMSLGRGVALRVESAELGGLHRGLAGVFAEHLSAQDRQGFRPHVVVQNKVSGEAARELLETLRVGFVEWEAEAVGLDWWEYLGGAGGGAWEWRETFGFGV